MICKPLDIICTRGRGHARGADPSARIAGYLGKHDPFDQTIATFAVAGARSEPARSCGFRENHPRQIGSASTNWRRITSISWGTARWFGRSTIPVAAFVNDPLEGGSHMFKHFGWRGLRY